ncbi:hypothetical protein [Lysinibacillus sp. BW-2-10]|uniref:hypothetical protein n=1 Tax=Lysinibacillus sp. BW-2-10 TaxID=2590030 RepID=UPI00117ECD87|nr:hypothetical protein [Lysinibacillus sp. BW-2-10]TSI04478.1 hypothetical protein FJQ64_13980 [Lysinibacillus sp. BW-2-10]
MRTTRVQPVPSSIFRNSRQYLHSNELFYRVMEEGSGFGQGQQSSQQQPRQKPAQQKNSAPKRVLKRTTNKLIVKGLQFDADTAATMRNSLLEHAVRINAAYKRKSRISTYRTSI